QARNVEMIHVGMRQKYDVRPRNLAGMQRGFHQTPGPYGTKSKIHTNAVAEYRIGQHRHAIDPQQHGAVPQPRRMKAGFSPRVRSRPVLRLPDRSVPLARVLIPKVWNGPAN